MTKTPAQLFYREGCKEQTEEPWPKQLDQVAGDWENMFSWWCKEDYDPLSGRILGQCSLVLGWKSNCPDIKDGPLFLKDTNRVYSRRIKTAIIHVHLSYLMTRVGGGILSRVQWIQKEWGQGFRMSKEFFSIDEAAMAVLKMRSFMWLHRLQLTWKISLSAAH